MVVVGRPRSRSLKNCQSSTACNSSLGASRKCCVPMRRAGIQQQSGIGSSGTMHCTIFPKVDTACGWPPSAIDTARRRLLSPATLPKCRLFEMRTYSAHSILEGKPPAGARVIFADSETITARLNFLWPLYCGKPRPGDPDFHSVLRSASRAIVVVNTQPTKYHFE